MGKLRDHLGYGAFMVIAILTGVLCVVFFHINETIATFIGIAFSIVVFYLINKLADKKEIKHRENL